MLLGLTVQNQFTVNGAIGSYVICRTKVHLQYFLIISLQRNVWPSKLLQIIKCYVNVYTS